MLRHEYFCPREFETHGGMAGHARKGDVPTDPEWTHIHLSVNLVGTSVLHKASVGKKAHVSITIACFACIGSSRGTRHSMPPSSSSCTKGLSQIPSAWLVGGAQGILKNEWKDE